jgi:hypothetical protein
LFAAGDEEWVGGYEQCSGMPLDCREEWTEPGAQSRSRASVALPRLLSRATKIMRAPILASVSAVTSPIPDVPPVITTVLPLMSALVCLRDLTSIAWSDASGIRRPNDGFAA